MREFILDASIALAWCFVDEANPFADHLLDSLAITTAYVPTHWALEVSNVLVVAERRGRINYAEIVQFLHLLESLNLEVDDETTTRSFHESLALARSEKLTIYDAAYLELALRLGRPLATFDKALSAAATRVGVALVHSNFNRP